MSGRIDFSLSFGERDGACGAQSKGSYRVYIFGNFSGCGGRLSDQLPICQIDRDSFDQVMRKIKPALIFDGGLQLEFESLDDFHPDAWLGKVKMIADLQLLKMQLNNPVTAAQAVEKIQRFLPVDTDPASGDAQAAAIEETQGDMLQRLLGKKPDPMPGEADAVSRLLKEAVSPHISKAITPQHRNLIQIIDGALIQLTRAILHAEPFQRLEAIWRTTEALLLEESAEQQEFFLVNLGRDELLAAQASADAALATDLLQHVRRAGEEQQLILLGDFNFSASPEDRQVLAYCDSLATLCHSRFFAAADHALVEYAQRSDALNSFQQVVLVHPRYLVRLPYGQKLDPIETFAFEESSATPQAHELLWGCAAFLWVRGILRMAQGMSTHDAMFFADVPVFSFEQDGEQRLQSSSERVLSEAEANVLLAQGIVPLLGYHQRRGVRLLGWDGYV